MAPTTITVRVTANTRYARWYVHALRRMAPVLLPLLGEDRLMRWAERGAMRLIRTKIG